jgi:flagellar hook assembly protein FlgD
MDDGQSNNYYLEQNYPNPFNSDTIIQFNIPNSDEVTLSIYDVMGQRICTLVDDNLIAGNYSVSWNGKNDIGNSLPSGIYFYRIETGNYADVKRMILLK